MPRRARSAPLRCVSCAVRRSRALMRPGGLCVSRIVHACKHASGRPSGRDGTL